MTIATTMPPRGLLPGKEHRTAITVPEFKRWVKQFDTDRDGRISRRELREALRRRGVWFSGLRAQFAIWRADRNHDGFLDDSDIEGLIEFAERELGFMITKDDDAYVLPRPSSVWPSSGSVTMTGQSRSPTYEKSNNGTCSSDHMTYHSQPSSSVHSISTVESTASVSQHLPTHYPPQNLRGWTYTVRL